MEEGNNPEPPSQLRSTIQVSASSQPTVSLGSQPAIVLQIDPKQHRAFVSNLGSALGTLKKNFPGLAKQLNKKEWKEQLEAHFAYGLALNDRQHLFEFALMLVRDAKVPMPKTGAFWSDPDVGQVKAKEDLASKGGQVLADTSLGEIARTKNLKLGIGKLRKGQTDEQFVEEQAPALQFWGVISAIYALGLEGDVNIWLPKGLTVGSIFWNEELPALWERKEQGKVGNLIFHVHDQSGQWTAVTFEDLQIQEAYLTDAQGLNKGAKSLLNPQQNPDLLASRDPSEMVITLKKPLKVGELKWRLQAALDTARRRRPAYEFARRPLTNALARARVNLAAKREVSTLPGKEVSSGKREI